MATKPKAASIQTYAGRSTTTPASGESETWAGQKEGPSSKKLSMETHVGDNQTAPDSPKVGN